MDFTNSNQSIVSGQSFPNYLLCAGYTADVEYIILTIEKQNQEDKSLGNSLEVHRLGLCFH